jgi:hypothetical protein
VAVACASVAASGAGAATVSAGAAGVAKAPSAQGPHPLPQDRPPGWIAIDKVSDGCGQKGSIFRAHEQVYKSDLIGEQLTVDFTTACDLHDAGYSGALVWDGINGHFIDFSDPYWTKERVDEKFKLDLQRLCFKKFPDDPRWEKALHQCLTSDTLVKGGTWGAMSWYRVVRDFGSSPRERIKLTGRWKNTAPGWPVCDIGAHPWTITQSRITHNARFEPTGGREVTAEWKHGASGDEHGEFRGTFITGDKEGDDVVRGSFTITRGGQKVSGGEMTFKVLSEDKFDFNGTGVPGGNMARSSRSTQGVLIPVAPPRCKAPAPKPPAPPTQAGAFTLVSGLTEVKNPNAPELTVNTGGTAVWDHTGQFGGAGKGGEWRVDFTWKVPQTLTPGQSSSLTLGLQVSNVQPEQPILFQIGARAPDFKQIVDVHYPNPAGASKTFSIPVSAGWKDAKTVKELIVIIDVVSAEVIYHYRRP